MLISFDLLKAGSCPAPPFVADSTLLEKSPPPALTGTYPRARLNCRPHLGRNACVTAAAMGGKKKEGP